MDSSRSGAFQPSGVAVVILAAGSGSRMKSDLPKPLHHVAGLPMIAHVLHAARALDPSRIVLVTSPTLAAGWNDVAQFPDVQTVVQDPPLGTGHAALTAMPLIDNSEWVVILYADHPLVTGATLQRLLREAQSSRALVTLLTCDIDDAASYGRIDRDANGQIRGIVEAIDDDPSFRRGRIEINSGMMVLNIPWAREALARIPRNERKQEYFLTDIAAIANAEVSHEGAAVASVRGGPELLLGVNDRVELAAADGHLRDRIRRDLMVSGVTLVGPDTIFIDADVTIGRDTIVLPNSLVGAGTRIGDRCTIGPGSVIERSVIGNDVSVKASFVRDSEIRDASDVGPYAHLRNGALIHEQVHIGNYAEVKASQIFPGVRVGHFSYLGDAIVGRGTNVGAGTVTANYDGVAKHRTEIGSDVFIGSDTMLIAPVTVGDGAATGAGSVVTKDVAPGSLVVGMPARVVRSTRNRFSQAGKDGEA